MTKSISSTFNSQFSANPSSPTPTATPNMVPVSYATKTQQGPSSSGHRRRLPPIRYTIIGMISFGAFAASMSRITLSSSIISMTNLALSNVSQTNSVDQSTLSHCPSETESSSTVSAIRIESVIMDQPGANHSKLLSSYTTDHSAIDLIAYQEPKEFDWSESLQSTLLGGYHMGYVLALIPSGRISEHYGPKVVVTVGGLCNVILNFMSPFAARYNFWCFFVTRLLIGAATASLLPACFGLLSQWVPDNEKSKAIALISVGGSFGTIILSLLSGYLCLYGFDRGWPTVYYLTGFIAFIWFALWSLSVSDRPIDHPFITDSEIDYIERHLAHRRLRKGPVSNETVSRPPWIRMLFSRPVLSITYVKMVHSWVYNLLTLKLNSYLSVILQMSIEQISIFSSLFHLVLLVSVLLSGFLADLMISRYAHRKSAIRKGFESFSTFGSSIFIALLPFAGCSKLFFVGLMMVALACYGMSTGGSSTIVMDLTSEFAATLAAIMATISMFIGFVSPRLVSQILLLQLGTEPGHLQTQWYNVFYLTALIQISGGMLFVWFATTDYQGWEDSVKEHSSASSNGPSPTTEQQDKQPKPIKSNHPVVDYSSNNRALLKQ